MVIELNIQIILALAVAFLVSFASTPTVIAIANKIKAIDVPRDSRRVHKRPIPLIGGLAIFYGFVLSVASFAILDRQTIGLLIGSFIMVVVGIIDDKKDLDAKIKLIFQIIAALVVMYFGIRIDCVTNPFSSWIGPSHIELGIWSYPITMLWIVGITNAINLIDGLDGLAVGVSSIASVALLSLTLLSRNINTAVITAALAGACIGFLPYNFNPAKIFMGDTGSTFLGFALASISIMGITKRYALISFVIPIMILGLPIFDTFFAIARRVIKRKPIMSADRGHLHHRLLDMGYSQKQTVAILYTLTAILSLTAVVVAFNGVQRGVLLVAGTILIVVINLVIMKPKINNKNQQELTEGDFENGRKQRECL